MFTRRNWLLRCSILINIAVLLYICSHLMIGNNISGYVIQESTAAALRSNTGASNGVNIVMLQQTGDNTHDRQQQHQQPQELPQDAEPEPVVDNDSNQVIHLNSTHFNFILKITIHKLTGKKIPRD